MSRKLGAIHEQEKAKGKAGQIAESLTKLDLVILDELGYLPFSASGGALLFHLLSKLLWLPPMVQEFSSLIRM